MPWQPCQSLNNALTGRSSPNPNMLRSAPTLALAGSLFATALLLDQRFWVPATAPLAQEAALCAQGTDQGCLSTSVQPPQGLEDVLRQVPPTREVLVALGDSNMLTEADGAPSMFTMWLQVGCGAGESSSRAADPEPAGRVEGRVVSWKQEGRCSISPSYLPRRLSAHQLTPCHHTDFV